MQGSARFQFQLNKEFTVTESAVVSRGWLTWTGQDEVAVMSAEKCHCPQVIRICFDLFYE